MLEDQRRQAEQQRREAEEICRGLRSDSEDLLESHGVRKRMHPARVVGHTLLNLANAKVAALNNREMFPIGPTTYVAGTLDDGEGEPLRAAISTSTLRGVRNAGSIEVYVEGLGEHLVLGKKDAHIRVEGTDADFQDYRQRTRRVTLPEAQNWQRVVGPLKKQFPTDSSGRKTSHLRT